MSRTVPVVGGTDSGMFCELEKETALVVVIGLSKGHPGTSLCVHLAGFKNYLRHRSYNRNISIF